MSSQMLRQEIRRLAGPNVLLADSESELRNQLANLNKESNHAEETEEGQETQGSETGAEETPQGSEEEKEKVSQESPGGQEGSKDS